jgi:hypothetical protein
MSLVTMHTLLGLDPAKDKGLGQPDVSTVLCMAGGSTAVSQPPPGKVDLQRLTPTGESIGSISVTTLNGSIISHTVDGSTIAPQLQPRGGGRTIAGGFGFGSISMTTLNKRSMARQVFLQLGLHHASIIMS